MSRTSTILVTVTGRDRPGVTAGLFGALSIVGVTVLDVEQFVARGRLVLAVLVAPGPATPEFVREAARDAVERLGMSVDIEVGADDEPARRRDRVDVTVIGNPLRPHAITALAREIAARGGNIDRIRRIADYPVTAIAFEGSGADLGDLRRALALTAAAEGVDVAVRSSGLDSRGQHLVVMDVDSTLIQDEVIELLADAAGVMPQVREITERAMNGQVDFSEALAERVALLRGLPESVCDDVVNRVTLTPGARTLCRTLGRLGYHVALVSGGFTQVVDPIARELGIEHVRANRLEVVDGRLTGKVVGPIVDRDGKRRALEELAAEHGVPLSRTVAIGDGANDLDMLAAAGLGVAFNAKAVLRDAADATLSVPYLDSVLFLLGITRDEVESADEADGLEVQRIPV